MKKIYILFLSVLFTIGIVKAQTAMNFTMTDCNGVMHNLFDELDQNYVVVHEFFMLNCNSCVTAGDKIQVMVDDLNAEFNGHVLLYDFGYKDSYTCTSISNWVNDNGYNSVPFDSGAALVANYGGFGMPTIAVVAGSSHEVLFSKVGFSTNDTATMANAIRDFFEGSPLGVNETASSANELNMYPNPANDFLTVKLNIATSSNVKLQLYNIAGQLVQNIYSGNAAAGLLVKKVNTHDLKQGMYFMKATVDGISSISKITVVH